MRSGIQLGMSNGSKGRKPEYKLVVKPRDGASYSKQIGVAWRVKGPSGEGFTIALDPCVRIDWTDDVFIGLCPIQPQRERAADRQQNNPPLRHERLADPVEESDPFPEMAVDVDDIPFG